VSTRSAYYSLNSIYLPIAVGVFTLVAVLVVALVLRYRSSSRDFPEGRDEWTPVEIGYASLLACVAAVLVYFTFSHNSDLQARFDRPAPVTVKVTAARWQWRFTYPQTGAVVQGAGARIPTLYVPLGEPVDFRGKSIDVLHGFWIPSEKFKRDLFPQRTTSWQMTFHNPGFHHAVGECTVFCGLHHANMLFNVNVLPPARFERWARQRGREVQ
jgi:cytochrome c oxidase subunit 2